MTKTRNFYGSEGQRAPLGYGAVDADGDGEYEVETQVEIDFPEDLDESTRDAIESAVRAEVESSETGTISEERLAEIVREHAGEDSEIEIESHVEDETLGAGEGDSAGADEGSSDDEAVPAAPKFVEDEWTVQGLDEYVEGYTGDFDLSDYPHSGKKGDKIAFLNAAHKEQ